jgi:hypothetical protein
LGVYSAVGYFFKLYLRYKRICEINQQAHQMVEGLNLENQIGEFDRLLVVLIRDLG